MHLLVQMRHSDSYGASARSCVPPSTATTASSPVPKPRPRARTTLTRLIEDGLRLRPAQRAPKRAGLAPPPVFRGRGGLRPGIGPLSNASMLGAADEADFAQGKLP